MSPSGLDKMGSSTVDFCGGLKVFHPLPGTRVDAESELIVDLGPGSGLVGPSRGCGCHHPEGERGAGEGSKHPSPVSFSAAISCLPPDVPAARHSDSGFQSSSSPV